jgi:hypothetical protein
MCVFFSVCKKKAVNFSFVEKCLFVLSLVFIFGFSGGDKPEQELHYLHLKRVVTDETVVNKSEFEYGKRLYPEYSYHGLPDNFLIRKNPDISFRGSDIKLIEIKKLPFLPADMLEFIVTITFNDSAAARLYSYTQRNTNIKVALEVDKLIFIIASILDPIHEEMNITVGNRTIEEIKDEFSKICKNIKIGELKHPEPPGTSRTP